jgi:hypothetical protein
MESETKMIKRLLLTCIVVLTVLGLIACAAPGAMPSPKRVAATTVATEKLEQLISVSEAEWRRWGSRIVELPTGDKFCMRLTNGSCERVDDGCGQEQTSALCPVVNEYWRLVPRRDDRHGCTKTDICESRMPASGSSVPLDTPPWSAAFVSAMMQKAGFSDTEFRPSPSHAGYVVAARDGETSAYDVIPTPASAQPGDLICAPRNNAVITPDILGRIVAGSNATTLHCDIVVRVGSDFTLEAIGGNVQQSVSKTLVKLDSKGRVSAQINPNRKWALVMRARADVTVQATR